MTQLASRVLKLNCFVLGGVFNDIFSVDIPDSEDVAKLKKLILGERPDFGVIPANSLRPWKVSVPEAEFVTQLARVKTPDQVFGSVELTGLGTLSLYFPSVVQNHIHVILEDPRRGRVLSFISAFSWPHVS